MWEIQMWLKDQQFFTKWWKEEITSETAGGWWRNSSNSEGRCLGKNLGTARTKEEKVVLAEKKQERGQLAGFATWSENQSAVLQNSLMRKQQLLKTAWKKEMMYCLNITELIFFFYNLLQINSRTCLCLHLKQWTENSSGLVKHKLLAQRNKTEIGVISKC